MRRSSGSPPKRTETRPSCGARRSAMSSWPMIFRRVTTAGCIGFGIVATWRVTPSIRARTTISFSCGSKWMSEAPSSIACAIVVWTSLTAGRLAAGLGDLLALGGPLELRVVGGLLFLVDLDLRPVERLDRALEVGGLGDREARRCARAPGAGRRRGRRRSGRRRRRAAGRRRGTAPGRPGSGTPAPSGEGSRRRGRAASRRGRRTRARTGRRAPCARSALVTQLWPTAISPSRRPVRRCSSKACLTCSTVSRPRLISREPRCCQGRWAASTGLYRRFRAGT